MKDISKKEVFKRIGSALVVVILVVYVKDYIENEIDARLGPDHIASKSISTQQLRLVDESGKTRGSMSCWESNSVRVVLQSANGDSRIMMGVGDDSGIYFRLLQDVTDDSGSHSTKMINLTIEPDHTTRIDSTSSSSAPFQDSVHTSINLLRSE